MACLLELELHVHKSAVQSGAPSRPSRGLGLAPAPGLWAPAGQRPSQSPTRAPPSSRPAAAAQTRTPADLSVIGHHPAGLHSHVSSPFSRHMEQAGEISLAGVLPTQLQSFEGLRANEGRAHLLLNGWLGYQTASSRIGNCGLLRLRNVVSSSRFSFTSAFSAHQVLRGQTSLHNIVHAQPIAAARHSHLARCGPQMPRACSPAAPQSWARPWWARSAAASTALCSCPQGC